MVKRNYGQQKSPNKKNLEEKGVSIKQSKNRKGEEMKGPNKIDLER